MKTQRLAISLSIINMVLMVFLLAQMYRANASDVAPVLKGKALQIVDDQNRIRAEILTHGPETVNGKTYPETVLFRMATEDRAPLMKLTFRKTGRRCGFPMIQSRAASSCARPGKREPT